MKDKRGDAALAKMLQPSSNGNIVKTRYFLKISTEYDGMMCCAETPEAILPIRIDPPSKGLEGFDIEFPSNWNPKVLGDSEFSD